MSYWVLALIAVSAGVLFGSLPPPSWPWRRPNPVRRTIGFVLALGVLVLLVGAHRLGWDEGRRATGGLFAGVGLLIAAQVWLAPDSPTWTRLAAVLGYGWWLYFLYARYFAAS